MARLQENATISVVAGTLGNPIEYVRGVLENMLAYRKAHGSAAVRIGITGRGISPHYRLEPDADADRMLNDFVEGGEKWERYFVAYDGRNHKQLDWGSQELKGEHWSRTPMSVDAVQRLIGELRGLKGKR